MSTSDVSDTLDDALSFTGLTRVKVKHKPRRLSDDGPSYISGELAEYLQENDMGHTRGRSLTIRRPRAISSVGMLR